MRHAAACVAAAVLGCSTLPELARAFCPATGFGSSAVTAMTEHATLRSAFGSRGDDSRSAVSPTTSTAAVTADSVPVSFYRQQSRGGSTVWSRLSATAVSTLTGETGAPTVLPDEITAENPLRVVIAGGGVGGLLAAKYLKMQGHDVSMRTKLSVVRRCLTNSV